MARYKDAVCRLCRREGVKLFLKGERCFGDKCSLTRRSSEKRSNAPGQHGKRVRKLSDYGLQLRGKQKASRTYGILERQFRNYFEKAERKKGITGEILLQTLERRLDNVIYRLGLSSSRAQARQLVRHNHILVSGKRVNIPSFLVSPNDTIEMAVKSKKMALVKEAAEQATQRGIVPWLELDADSLSGKVLNIPTREEIDPAIKEQLIVEFYSR
ncbi:MAG: 30S ribosomal protein S4 [Armatimonadetes bacterium CG07_land_8_20_14_0_80_40_9]|nr:MAG: 30S ribosomal protein S4 [Armatimonadetes bacterium CG07_land_8_20_14_0_80_40_9]